MAGILLIPRLLPSLRDGTGPNTFMPETSSLDHIMVQLRALSMSKTKYGGGQDLAFLEQEVLLDKAASELPLSRLFLADHKSAFS